MRKCRLALLPVSVALYRQCLGVVRQVQGERAEHRAFEWWAEFLPARLVLTPHARLQMVLRECFERPMTADSLPNAFVFLREARTSLPSLEMLALWEELQSREFPFLDGLALQAAVLRCTGAVTPVLSSQPRRSTRKPEETPPSLRQVMQGTSRTFDSAVCRVLASLREAHGGHNPPAGDLDSLKALILEVHSLTGYARRGLAPEDFTILSLVTDNKASEEILNIFLFHLLAKMGLNVSLVGVDLSFRWVRVQPPGSGNAALVFATWSYGAFGRDELGKFVHTQNSQWFTTKPWDATFRRTLLCSLLRKQLSCAGSGVSSVTNSSDTQETVTKEKMQKACKEQLLFLLT